MRKRSKPPQRSITFCLSSGSKESPSVSLGSLGFSAPLILNTSMK